MSLKTKPHIFHKRESWIWASRYSCLTLCASSPVFNPSLAFRDSKCLLFWTLLMFLWQECLSSEHWGSALFLKWLSFPKIMSILPLLSSSLPSPLLCVLCLMKLFCSLNFFLVLVGYGNKFMFSMPVLLCNIYIKWFYRVASTRFCRMPKCLTTWQYSVCSRKNIIYHRFLKMYILSSNICSLNKHILKLSNTFF